MSLSLSRCCCCLLLSFAALCSQPGCAGTPGRQDGQATESGEGEEEVESDLVTPSPGASLEEECQRLAEVLRASALRGDDLATMLDRVAEVIPPRRIIGLRVSRWETHPDGDHLVANRLLDLHRFDKSWVRPDDPRASAPIEVASKYRGEIEGRLAHSSSSEDLKGIAEGKWSELLRLEAIGLVTASVPAATKGLSYKLGPKPLEAKEGDITVQLGVTESRDPAIGDFSPPPFVE